MKQVVLMGLVALILFSCATQTLAESSSPSPAWVQTWGGGNDDRAHGVVVSNSGAIYVGGNTLSSVSGNTDMLLLKYSENGTLEWAESWDLGSSESLHGVAVGNDGAVVAIAGAQSNNDALFLKVDDLGNILWAKLWDLAWDPGDEVHVDNLGNIYFGITSNGNGDIDAVLLKYDTDGNVLWSSGRAWDYRVNDGGVAGLDSDPSGNVYVTSYTGPWSWPDPGFDAYLLKYDANGNLLWDRVWDAPDMDVGLGIAYAAEGAIYVTGFTKSSGAGGEDVLLLKFDTDGNLTWARTWGGADTEEGRAVSIGLDGSVFVAGVTRSYGAGERDVVLLQYDASGNLISQQTWGSPGDEDIQGIVIGVGAQVYISGVAPDCGGSWQDVVGSEGAPVYPVLSDVGTVSPINGNEMAVSPTETTLPGVECVGGGGADALLLTLTTCSLEVPPCPFPACDVNCDGFCDALDLAYLIDILFAGEPVPSPCCRFQ